MSKDELAPQMERQGNDSHEIHFKDTEWLTERRKDLLQSIKKVLEDIERHQLRSLRQVDRKRLHEAAMEVNEVLSHIEATDITETNRLIRAAVGVASHDLGISQENFKWKKEPLWKRKIQGNIDQLNRGLSKLERKEKNLGNRIKRLAHIKNKYNVKRKGRKAVIEKMKQWVTAKAA